jgi:hypothetical protein
MKYLLFSVTVMFKTLKTNYYSPAALKFAKIVKSTSICECTDVCGSVWLILYMYSHLSLPAYLIFICFDRNA